MSAPESGPESAPESGPAGGGDDAAPFTLLASVYDSIMAEVEYDDWVAFILDLAHARASEHQDVTDYLAACKKHPKASVLAWR